MTAKIIQAILPKRVGRFLVTFGSVYNPERKESDWYIRLWHGGKEKLIPFEKGVVITTFYTITVEQAEQLWERN